MGMSSLAWGWKQWSCAALLGCLLIGCSQSARHLKVDEVRARAVCETFLNAWKAGKQPADLQPEIIGSDFEWKAQSQLLAFEIQSKTHNDGANLHIPVRLTLKNTKGSELKSDVVYIVSTAPAVTIFRE